MSRAWGSRVARDWEFAFIEGEATQPAAIIVTDANALVAPLHDRMPVILLPESHPDWLNPDTGLMRLRQLLVPVDPSILDTYRAPDRECSGERDVPSPLFDGVN